MSEDVHIGPGVVRSYRPPRVIYYEGPLHLTVNGLYVGTLKLFDPTALDIPRDVLRPYHPMDVYAMNEMNKHFISTAKTRSDVARIAGLVGMKDFSTTT